MLKKFNKNVGLIAYDMVKILRIGQSASKLPKTGTPRQPRIENGVDKGFTLMEKVQRLDGSW